MLIIENGLFKFEKTNFPITVDYSLPLGEAWEKAISHVKSWNGAGLDDKRTFSIKAGIHKFNSYLAKLQRDDYLWEMEKDLAKAGIVPADMRQLFAFCEKHLSNAVTDEQRTPIVAAAKGSTWRCSHGCLHELASVQWDPFYHNPGPTLHHTDNIARFKVGTRFLTIRP